MTTDELNSLYASAKSAMASEDWSGAVSYLMQLQAALAVTPNASRGGPGGKQAYDFNEGGLDTLINQCRRQHASKIAASSTAGPFQTSKVTYGRAT
jgi:hypothetical protein